MTGSPGPAAEGPAARRRSPSLGARLGAGLALLLLLVAGFATWQLLLVQRLHEANRLLASADLEVSRSSLRMRLVIDRLENLTGRFLVLRDPGYRAKLDRVRELGAEELATLEELPGPPEGLAVVRERWAGYQELAGRVEPQVPAGREPAGARDALVAELEAVREGLTQIDSAAARRVSERMRDSSARAATARRTALAVVGGGVLCAVALALWIRRSTVGPLRALAAGTHALAAGELGHRVRVEGPAEVESLARDFNAMAERLAEVDGMKRDFLSSVSHDLKAPLASMQETNRLLLEDDSLGSEQARLLRLNTQSAERLQRMIADLLDVAQLEAGAVEVELEPLDLVACCRQVLDEAAGLLEAGSIRAELVASEEPLVVPADPRLLLKAIWNLVSNAIKFSSEGETIRLRLERLEAGSATDPSSPGLVALTVEDHGPGIPDDEKPRVFERFFRSRRHERYASGTGLGLAITRSIVERHDGEIRVADAPGGGTLFTVLLPATPREAREA
ncbi:MAG: HAMP domain-containing sensor histidine kinase [Thermoanaerobaculia bacterium]|nr:HAMP domain-containing sensor histidine kinase [Thermoanaerobaculia bacterium]